LRGRADERTKWSVKAGERERGGCARRMVLGLGLEREERVLEGKERGEKVKADDDEGGVRRGTRGRADWGETGRGRWKRCRGEKGKGGGRRRVEWGCRGGRGGTGEGLERCGGVSS
jgi:hypothetical protein